MKSLISVLSRLKTDIGIQHRDIKPSNILFINGEWNLADFGVSQFSKSLDVNQTAIIGTPAFMSPQLRFNYKQLKKQEDENMIPVNFYKADVFSLGLTILNALSLESVANLNRSKNTLDERLAELEELALYKPCIIGGLRRMLAWEEIDRP